MTRSTLPGEDGRLPIYPLRLFRVEPGMRVHAWCLTEPLLADGRIAGLFIHYTRFGSKLCDGETCPTGLHRLPVLWRGYLYCVIYDQRKNLWEPHCLEVTESLETDMREQYRRGQVWELWRESSKKGGNRPVQGLLLEERPEKTCPAALDLIPLLQRVYSRKQIDLCEPNPLPPRVMVSAIQAAPPAGVKAREPEAAPPTDEQKQQIAEVLGKLSRGARPPG